MKFSTPLISGKLVQRYKRFLADVELPTGEIITAHCPNSGAMLGVKDPGSPVRLTQHPENSKRKLRYTLEFVFADNVWVGVNTFRPNFLVEEGIKAGIIKELCGYDTLKREVPYGENSRIDLLLKDNTQRVCYVEVKNAHLKQGDFVQFPDSVTARGSKHLDALGDMVEQGARAVVIYIAQREDVEKFSVAREIDPMYAAQEEKARARGVEFLCYGCQITPDEIIINRSIPVF